MKFVTSIIKKFFPKELPKPMGRWQVEYCNQKMDNKIDLSNEDHCGPCGQYALTQLKNKNINKNNISHNHLENLK